MYVRLLPFADVGLEAVENAAKARGRNSVKEEEEEGSLSNVESFRLSCDGHGSSALVIRKSLAVTK